MRGRVSPKCPKCKKHTTGPSSYRGWWYCICGHMFKVRRKGGGKGDEL